MLYRTKSPISKSKSKILELAKPTRPAPKEDLPIVFKINLIPGLKSVVLDEISKYKELKTTEIGENKIYIEFISDFKNIIKLRSILNAYVVKRGEKFNPYFISNHKSVLGELIDIVLGKKEILNKPVFKTFTLRCAGKESKEVLEIQNYIANTYKLTEAEDADMEIYISKPNDLWEVSVRLTPRPLSLRDYRVANIKGGLNPTIAYAMNTFCNLSLPSNQTSYLNIFSGSGTLLIEAGLSNPKLKLIGFDIDGKSNSLAVQNIKKAGLIKQIQLKTADILNNPDLGLGKFDIITSDLPFGMQISKNENLEKLYQSFIKYSEENLNSNGSLIVYTTEYELLDKLLKLSKFNIIKTLNLVVPTSIGSYIYPRIFVCGFK